MELEVKSSGPIPSLEILCTPTNLAFTIEIRHGHSFGYSSEEEEKINVPPHDYLMAILRCRDQSRVHEIAKYKAKWEAEDCFEALLDVCLKDIKAKALRSKFAKSFRIQREQLNQETSNAI